MKKLQNIFFILFILSCGNTSDEASTLIKEQQNLISEEITGSNAMLVVKDGKTIFNHIENSGKLGDKDISDKTIFPIWSMSKPITTVAMMIL